MILTYNNIINTFNHNYPDNGISKMHYDIINTINKCKQYVQEYRLIHNLSYEEVMNYATIIVTNNYMYYTHNNKITDFYNTLVYTLSSLEGRLMHDYKYYNLIADSRKLSKEVHQLHQQGNKALLYYIIAEHLYEIAPQNISFKEYRIYYKQLEYYDNKSMREHKPYLIR